MFSDKKSVLKSDKEKYEKHEQSDSCFTHRIKKTPNIDQQSHELDKHVVKHSLIDTYLSSAVLAR